MGKKSDARGGGWRMPRACLCVGPCVGLCVIEGYEKAATGAAHECFNFSRHRGSGQGWRSGVPFQRAMGTVEKAFLPGEQIIEPRQQALFLSPVHRIAHEDVGDGELVADQKVRVCQHTIQNAGTSAEKSDYSGE